MDIATAAKFGRVTADGTVFVNTADGEKQVGQYQAGTQRRSRVFCPKVC